VLDRLAELGCDIGQGYGISRPLPPGLFERWLHTTEYRIGEFPSAEAGVVL
jgi:EAL domain-containing protein (putative c-di-GMP-specific phosphodiesterase class I)